MEEEKPWEKDAREAKERKELQIKFPFLGKKVRRRGHGKWEEGIVVLDKFDDVDYEEEFIKFAEDDLEQLIGLPFQVFNEETNEWNEPKM